MNCIQFKDVLFEFVDRSLNESSMSQAQQHLKSCTVCTELHAQELNVSAEPLTELIDEIHELELKEETISEITTKILELAKGQKRVGVSG